MSTAKRFAFLVALPNSLPRTSSVVKVSRKGVYTMSNLTIAEILARNSKNSNKPMTTKEASQTLVSPAQIELLSQLTSALSLPMPNLEHLTVRRASEMITKFKELRSEQSRKAPATEKQMLTLAEYCDLGLLDPVCIPATITNAEASAIISDIIPHYNEWKAKMVSPAQLGLIATLYKRSGSGTLDDATLFDLKRSMTKEQASEMITKLQKEIEEARAGKVAYAQALNVVQFPQDTRKLGRAPITYEDMGVDLTVAMIRRINNELGQESDDYASYTNEQLKTTLSGLIELAKLYDIDVEGFAEILSKEFSGEAISK